MEILLIPMLLGMILLVTYVYVMVPYEMAHKRNRSVELWIIVSLLISPLAAIIGLWILGKKER